MLRTNLWRARARARTVAGLSSWKRASHGAPLTRSELRDLLSKPSWSVKELQSRPENTEHTTVTPKELHHLLRLSALPLPTSVEEEKKMIHTLESQLHFVRAIQTVDTSGVEPLQSIRDETAQAQEDNEIGLGTLKDELDREHQGGFARRITRRRDTTDTTDVQTGNPLGQAPKKYGRYIVVNTKTA